MKFDVTKNTHNTVLKLKERKLDVSGEASSVKRRCQFVKSATDMPGAKRLFHVRDHCQRCRSTAWIGTGVRGVSIEQLAQPTIAEILLANPT